MEKSDVMRLIARQTGRNRLKRRSRTDHPSANPSKPGMVFAPSPLASMTRATSPPPTAIITHATTEAAPVQNSSRTESVPPIQRGHDGVSYSADPSSDFAGLLVSVDRDLVDIEGVEYTRQAVLVAKKAPRPSRALGPETNLGEQAFRMAKEGAFEGYLVGTNRRVTRLGGEDYVKFVVLVPRVPPLQDLHQLNCQNLENAERIHRKQACIPYC